MRRPRFACLRPVTLALACLAASAPAGALDAKEQALCAAIDVIACLNGPDCLRGQARDFELHEFWLVDFAKKEVRAADEAGRDEVSPIAGMQETERKIILQGMENHRAWSATIDRKTGRLAVSSVGADVSFMIFGACTAR